VTDNVKACLDIWHRLDRLCEAGLGESEEADRVRDEAELLWRRLTAEEEQEARAVIDAAARRGEL